MLLLSATALLFAAVEPCKAVLHCSVFVYACTPATMGPAGSSGEGAANKLTSKRGPWLLLLLLLLPLPSLLLHWSRVHGSRSTNARFVNSGQRPKAAVSVRQSACKHLKCQNGMAM
jgi:hypothetical protein